MIDREAFAHHLEWAEDRRPFPYEDTAIPPRITIGVGRNLSDVGLSQDEIDLMLQNDIDKVLRACESLSYWERLDPVRQLVVADMVFNMGLSRWRGFVKANRALEMGDYVTAAAEMIDSRWYRQTGRRAVKLVDAMQTGQWAAAA